MLKSIRCICNKSGNYTDSKLVVVAAVVVVECDGTQQKQDAESALKLI
jgi:cell division protein ZapA (FtsZ GTPase activity inhibitor)